MSHTTTLYPQSTGGLTLGNESLGLVREDEPENRSISSALVQFTDLVDKKLPQIRAVGWALESGKDLPEECVKDLGLLIVDLIDDVMLAHRAMWAEYERQREKK